MMHKGSLLWANQFHSIFIVYSILADPELNTHCKFFTVKLLSFSYVTNIMNRDVYEMLISCDRIVKAPGSGMTCKVSD